MINCVATLRRSYGQIKMMMIIVPTFTCTILFEQIKGYWLVVIPCLAGICKDVCIVVHVRIDCGIYIASTLNNTLNSIATQMVQGLPDYAQKFTYYTSLAAPDPSLTL